jgi:LacI family transcriptional regulator
VRGFRAALAGSPAAARAIEELGAPSQSDFGREAVARLLSRRSPPTAIVMGSVRITQGVLEELLVRGVRVPDELSVIGFGDEVGFSWWGPGLTTIGLPILELATACGLWFLHHHLQNKGKGADGPYSAMSPATLIVRGSTRAIGSAPMDRSDAKKSARRVTSG